MNSKIILLIKIGLAGLLLFCLADFPYSYYQFVRFLSFVGFGLMAYDAYEQKKQLNLFLWIALALLFQPFLKVSLGRNLWNIVDLFVAIGLLASIFPLRNRT